MKKIVGITGVSGGIGSALAREFLGRGYDVIGVDLVDKNIPGVRTYCTDLSQDESALQTFAGIHSHHPELSIWVNNAGLARLGAFETVEQSEFDRVMNINFRALVVATRFWLEKFRERGNGQLVNIASVAGLIPAGEMSSYVASKHAVVGFTRALQLENTNPDITLSLVTPGFVETELMQIGSSSGFPEKLKSLVATPKSCAKEIVDGILDRRAEFTPTLSGKMMTGIYNLPFGERMAALAYKLSKK